MSAGIKTILIIGLVQLAAIVLLFGRIAAIENDIQDSGVTDSEVNLNDHPSLSGESEIKGFRGNLRPVPTPQ